MRARVRVWLDTVCAGLAVHRVFVQAVGRELLQVMCRNCQQHEDVHVRTMLFRVLACLVKVDHGPLASSAAAEAVLGGLRPLVTGLYDGMETVRTLYQDFWHERLKTSAPERLEELLKRTYYAKHEEHWLGASCHLLLKLCASSDTYNDELHTALDVDAEARRRPHKVDSSWSRVRPSLSPALAHRRGSHPPRLLPAPPRKPGEA